MAKKRVHQIAKERGIPSKEVIAILQRAGLDVKAAASSVDEAAVARAFGDPDAPPAPGEDGASAREGGAARDNRSASRAAGATRTAASSGRATARAADGPASSSAHGTSAHGTAREPSDGVADRTRRQGAGGRAEGTSARTEGGQGRVGAGSRRAAPGERSARPRTARPARLGEGGRRRRVVIDAQASRPERPGGPAAPPGQRPRRRSRRRSQPFPEQEPAPTDTTVVEEAPAEVEEAVPVRSGSTVKEVAEALGVPAPEVIKKLMELGELATLTQTLSDEAIEVLADALGKRVEVVGAAEEETAEPEVEDDSEQLEPRPPVVTVMGHVDHGKTSLLDAIRKTDVAAREAGGITQHIGAYQVTVDGHRVTFIDTPGHEAFTALRARGAQVTDIAVIVVAADDGVMPQTLEAIDHARAAGVPIIVAVNKIDRENADPQRVRAELAAKNLTPVEWGGDTEFVDVSAKTGQGLDQLLETIVTLAELSELRANPNAPASGTVIESRLDAGRGPVATLLVQRGTLRLGDPIVAGTQAGRVRAMTDYRGERLKEAGPGTPVEVLGFDGVPEAGDRFRVVESEREARRLAQERAQRLKQEALARQMRRRVSLEDVLARAERGERQLNLIVKADVTGSLEAIVDEIAKLPQDEVTVNIIREGVGGITESDVMLAAASDAVIIGFNVRPVGGAAAAAQREGVEIRTYSVIYQVAEDLKAAMEGLLEPEQIEEVLGVAEVRAIFKASRIGTIAGCYVREGMIRRGARARLVRDGTVVYDGRIASLRRFKDDVREVQAGLECGLTLENFQDVKEGDVIEAYEVREVEKKLA